MPHFNNCSHLYKCLTQQVSLQAFITSTSGSLNNCLKTSVSLQQVSHFNKCLISKSVSLNRSVSLQQVSHSKVFHSTNVTQVPHFNKCLYSTSSYSTGVSLQEVSDFNKCLISTSVSLSGVSHFIKCFTSKNVSLTKCLTSIIVSTSVSLNEFLSTRLSLQQVAHSTSVLVNKCIT